MRSSLLVCACGLLAACDKGGDSSSSRTEEPTGNGSGDDLGGSKVDLDGDGYDSTEDCNDKHPAVNPGATERCDGIDNDCDSDIDIDDDSDVTGGSTYYRDADGDGWGDMHWSTSTTACEMPSGYVDNNRDCYDWRAYCVTCGVVCP